MHTLPRNEKEEREKDVECSELTISGGYCGNTGFVKRKAGKTNFETFERERDTENERQKIARRNDRKNATP